MWKRKGLEGAGALSPTFCAQFRLDSSSLVLEGALLTGKAQSAVPGSPGFDFSVRCMATGSVQVRIVEAGMKPRWESPDILVPEGLVSAEGVAQVASTHADVVAAGASGDAFLAFTSGDGQKVVVAIGGSPLAVRVFVGGVEAVSINSMGKLYFEHRRQRDGSAARSLEEGSAGAGQDTRKILDWGEDGKPIYADEGDVAEAPVDAQGSSDDGAGAQGRELAGHDQAGMWEESFGSHTDTKPNGPMSVGSDISFPFASAVYGIPEHATDLALKHTDGSAGGYSEPYRLYNLDVFEYEMDNPMALYGSIPVMVAANAEGRAAGVFWNNPTETFVDVAAGPSGSGKTSRWMSESGVFDVWVLAGPTAHAVFKQYASITGTQALPPKFALAYHQCRWNYKDEGDVAAVDAGFEEHDFPYDVIWLDIEHTDGKRYFTWDKHLFPNPVEMQNKLAARGHKMVTIVDPHIKRDNAYAVHSEATSKGLYIKDKHGGDLDGWCWPGSSSYLDFTAPHVREWWADRFSLDNYQGSTLNLFTWNDMNEPSVFNGPEVSMDKDALSLAGVEHREWHNMYGFYQQWATGRGQVKRNENEEAARPFVLTRAFSAGSQRMGAIWTGDNAAEWDHLRASVPMLLTINIAGQHFAGADVGGFFGNPDAELLTRWYQAGAYQPFFRAHAHIDTKRREPWLFGEETLQRLRAVTRERYALLPLWYTVFYQSHVHGLPVMRPLWVEFPGDAALLSEQGAWMVGDALLVAPVMHQGASSVKVPFPGSGTQWYDVRSFQAFQGGVAQVVQAPLDTVPVFQRSGTIVPRQERPRRSSALMANDPYTLTIAPSSAGSASGQVFMDDGESFAFTNGAFSLLSLAYANAGSEATLTASVVDGGVGFQPSNSVERIRILGVERAPSAVTSTSGTHTAAVTFAFDSASGVLTLRKPVEVLASSWNIKISW